MAHVKSDREARRLFVVEELFVAAHVEQRESDNEALRFVRSTVESGSAKQLRVPLRRLIVGTEHVGRVFLIKKCHQ